MSAAIQFAPPSPSDAATLPPPTLPNVPYGSYQRQLLDFWQAPSSAPSPVIFFIHGGGWVGGDKSRIAYPKGIEQFLDRGISFVSINYRYLPQVILKDETVPIPNITREIVATEDPPVKLPLYDAARALQFVRSKAVEWNIDKARIALSGGSAGACTSLWLAFHRDLADPASPDPVARESTRPFCVAALNCQSSLDPYQIKEWSPNIIYGGHAFGYPWNPNDLTSEWRAFHTGRDIVLPWIKEYSPFELVTADSPPICLWFENDVPEYGKEKKDPNHSANNGAMIEPKLRALGVDYEFVYPGAPNVMHRTPAEYLIDRLLERN